MASPCRVGRSVARRRRRRPPCWQRRAFDGCGGGLGVRVLLLLVVVGGAAAQLSAGLGSRRLTSRSLRGAVVVRIWALAQDLADIALAVS